MARRRPDDEIVQRGLIETTSPLDLEKLLDLENQVGTIEEAIAYLDGLGWTELADRYRAPSSPAPPVGAAPPEELPVVAPSETGIGEFVPRYVVTLPFYCRGRVGNPLNGGTPPELVEIFASRMRASGVHAAPESYYDEEWERFVGEG
jgi:hypothetical protein